MKENKDRYPIKKACKILRVARSGYYQYLQRKKSSREIEREALGEIITKIFTEHNGRYGAKRIQKALEKEKITVNHKRVQRIMARLSLVAKGTGKRYKRNTAESTPVGQNILNRVFSTEQPNKVWVGDITDIPTKRGFLYLSVFIDIYSRKVVGWSMSTRLREEIVLDAIGQAIEREHPKAGLIVHTDRGAQYTSKAFVQYLDRKGFVQSYSRKGNPYDNAVMESFYRTLKRELVRDAHYEHPEQAKLEIFKYIETYYNTKRLHSSLNYLSPTEFESRNQN